MTSLSYRWRHQLPNWRVFILDILFCTSFRSDGLWRHRLSRFMTSLKEKKLSWIFMNTEGRSLFTTPCKNIHESCRLNLEMNCWSSIAFKDVISYDVIASKKNNISFMKLNKCNKTVRLTIHIYIGCGKVYLSYSKNKKSKRFILGKRRNRSVHTGLLYSISKLNRWQIHFDGKYTKFGIWFLRLQ